MTEFMVRPRTREQWLELAVLKLRPLFAEQDIELPALRVSVGWPSKGGTGSKRKVIGQCWKSTVASDGLPQLFISPALPLPGGVVTEVLATLVHELIHAVDDCESGHKGAFGVMARAMGLEGKLTATHAGADLEVRLGQIIDEIGAYPHSALNPFEMEKQRPKQKTRMIKLVAPDCDYTVRTTQKWIDEGLPMCPHGMEMQQDGDSGDGE